MRNLQRSPYCRTELTLLLAELVPEFGCAPAKQSDESSFAPKESIVAPRLTRFESLLP